VSVVWVVLVVFTALAGLAVGSFLTVVADRFPRGASLLSPPSHCDACGTELRPLDLVPVLSWVVLRGKCRRCHVSIGVEAPALELACGGLFLGMALHFHRWWVIAAFCVLSAGLVVQAAIDFRTKRLPREITYVTAALGAPLLVVAALVDHQPRRIATAAAGAAIALVFMALLYAVSRGGMGDGDVRFSPLLGMYLGWLGLPYVPVGLFLGFFLGAVTGLAAMATGKAGRRTMLPFGPFLAGGTVLAVYVGRAIIDRVWPS
jgi:leader peptidase (prepilin peptidase) / N-methyltransferase